MEKITILKQGNYSEKEVQELKDINNASVIDIYEQQLSELFEIRNAQLIFSPDFKLQQDSFIKESVKEGKDLKGNWVYYPWRNTLVHMVTEDEYFELRTNRNRNLITLEEQRKLKNTTIAFAGLSIGSSTLEAIVYSGVGNKFVIADFDTLDTTNLNRIKANLLDVGNRKTDIAIKRALEIDPYVEFITYEDGLNDQNYEQFVDNDKPNIIFEAIDSLKMKILLRKKAKEAGVPVVMFTNLGDGVMIDIERYDTNPETLVFNGKIPDEVIDSVLNDTITKENINKYVLQLVGMENIPQIAIESIQLIGKELVGRPQLASTVGISGNLGAYVARKIILGEKISSGRILTSFSNFID